MKLSDLTESYNDTLLRINWVQKFFPNASSENQKFIDSSITAENADDFEFRILKSQGPIIAKGRPYKLLKKHPQMPDKIKVYSDTEFSVGHERLQELLNACVVRKKKVVLEVLDRTLACQDAA